MMDKNKLNNLEETIDKELWNDTIVVGSSIKVLNEALINIYNSNNIQCVMDCTYICEMISAKVDECIDIIECTLVKIRDIIRECETDDTVRKR